MIDRVQPSVVQVRGRGRGGGAGVVWRSNGTIITNHHVVVGNGGQHRVLFPNGRELPAQVIASDQSLDLALLRVEASDLNAVPIGDSTQLRIGELVFAVGHPWGQPWTVTAGIVSGLGEVASPGRNWKAQYIRSDVRLGPGNSGGPLLNARGEVVGINAMIFGGDLGVAIPSHVAHRWESRLGQGRVHLGVSVQSVALPAATRQGRWAERSNGLLVVAVTPNSPAERAGLLLGDVVLDIDDIALEDTNTLVAALGRHAPGEQVGLNVWRAGALQSITVQLETLE